MKKITVLSLIFIILLCGCGNRKTPDAGSTGIANPVTEITKDVMAEELGLRGIPIEGDYKKINGNGVIYSIDTENREYNIRLALSGTVQGSDITGVYLGKGGFTSVFDSANADISPTVTVESDGNYLKAYGEWKGYVFGVSTKLDLSSEEMRTETEKFVTTLLA